MRIPKNNKEPIGGSVSSEGPKMECNDEYCMMVEDDKKKEDFIYDSVKIHFTLKVFVWELLVHLFWPLFNWYAPIMHAHHLAGAGVVEAIIVITPNSLLIVAIVTYFLVPDGNAEILVPVMLHVIHKTMVAFKYSTLSPTEYRKVMDCTDHTKVNTFRNQMQLLRGWMHFNYDVFEFETYGAAARVGVNIDSLHFLIPAHTDENDTDNTFSAPPTAASTINGHSPFPNHSRMNTGDDHAHGMKPHSKYVPVHSPYSFSHVTVSMAQKWDYFLRLGRDQETFENMDAGAYDGCRVNKRRRISVHDVLQSCIQYAVCPDTFSLNNNYYLSIASAAVIALLPWMFKVPFIAGYVSLGLTVRIITTYLTFFFAFVCLQFLFAATVDTERRMRLAELLTRLVRPVQRDYSPHVSLFDSKHISIWNIARGIHPRKQSRGSNDEDEDSDEENEGFEYNVDQEGIMTRRPTPGPWVTGSLMKTVSGIVLPRTNSKSKKKVFIAENETDNENDLEHPVGDGVVVLATTESAPGLTVIAESAEEKRGNDEETGTVKPAAGSAVPIVADDSLPNKSLKSKKSKKEATPKAPTTITGYRLIVPKVDFEIPQNIYAWMYTRLVIQNYGSRMLLRINIYAGAMFLLVFVCMAGVIITVLHSHTPLKAAMRPVTLQCLMLAGTSMLVLVKYIFLGARLNDEFAKHRNLLVLNAMHCESELAELVTALNDSRGSTGGPVVDIRGNDEAPVALFSSKGQASSAYDAAVSGKSTASYADFSSVATPGGGGGGEGVTMPNQVHIPHSKASVQTRIKIYELEESIKAMRRAVDAIDISNKEYIHRVVGIPANTALIVSLLSSAGAFTIALFQAMKTNKQVV